MQRVNAKVTLSDIYYNEILDAHPHSADTMRHAADILLQNYSFVYQNGHVIVVGDGKTYYDHLMKIKCLKYIEVEKT